MLEAKQNQIRQIVGQYSSLSCVYNNSHLCRVALIFLKPSEYYQNSF